jgi:putative transposase
MAEMDRIHTKHPYMGQRKIVKKLEEAGFKVGRKLVRNYMQQMGIFPIYPKPNLSKRNFKEGIMPYLLRNMNIYMPNQVWSIDITFIKMLHGHMYLTAIIDWYSRKIVGWNLSDTLDTVHVINTVLKAVEEYGVPGIINSDQGSQFTSNEYKELLKSLNIRQSMDGKSRWADNVIVERWFRSLKTEKIYINEFRTPKELRTSIREYINEYNSERPHEAHEYATPDDIYYGSFRSENKAVA